MQHTCVMKVKSEGSNVVNNIEDVDAIHESSPVDLLDHVDNSGGKVTYKDKYKDKYKDQAATVKQNPPEIGGAAGPDPTRYGDWEHKGRCYDF